MNADVACGKNASVDPYVNLAENADVDFYLVQMHRGYRRQYLVHL